MTDQKSDAPKGVSNQNKGSGSDTASAAKISAGTSVGNVGDSPMPHSQTGGNQPGQSSSLASHTSNPMGGNAGSTGAGRSPQTQTSTSPGGPGQSAQGRSPGTQGSSQGAQGSSQSGMADTAKQTAAQVQEKAGEVFEQASDWAQDTYERASSWASDAFENSSDQFGRTGQRFSGAGRGVQRYVAENPVMVGLVGLAAGLLLGALLPRTRREDEAFGEWADEVREQGLRYAHGATQRGREFVEEAFTGEDPRFSKHESDFRPAEGPGGVNRH
jgi:ElaB/YqjD/DUF883 family membrane-anchored ribosome-binding protein